MNAGESRNIDKDSNKKRLRHTKQRGRVVSASDSGSGGRGFDSRPSHVVIALGKQFTLTFNILHMG